MAAKTKWEGKIKDKAIALVFQSLLEGSSLRETLSNDRDKDKLPSRKTFKEWLSEDKVISAHYAHVCEVRADEMFDEMVEIADDGSNDWMEKMSEKGEISIVLDTEHINRSKLRIDTRKWILSKMNPKKYGERIQNDINLTDDRKEAASLFPTKEQFDEHD